MSVVIRERFATVEDTAKALGVPKSRMKWLINLIDANRVVAKNYGPKPLEFKNSAKRNRQRKRRAGKAHASRKARTRSRAAR